MIGAITDSRAAQSLSQQHSWHDPLSIYRVELAQESLDEQGRLIDWLISLAFDTLGACVLDLRIVAPEPTCPARHD